MTDRFIAWCARDTASARLQRTIVQGIIAVIIGLLIGWADAPAWVSMCAIPLIMAVLSPIQAAIGNKGETEYREVGGSD